VFYFVHMYCLVLGILVEGKTIIEHIHTGMKASSALHVPLELPNAVQIGLNAFQPGR